MSSDVSDPEPLTPAVKLMTLLMVKQLEPAYEPGLLNMLKCYNTFNTVGDKNI